jgi:hypothetical protein
VVAAVMWDGHLSLGAPFTSLGNKTRHIGLRQTALLGKFSVFGDPNHQFLSAAPIQGHLLSGQFFVQDFVQNLFR